MCGKNNFIENRSELSISIDELEKLTKPLLGEGIPYRSDFGSAGFQEFVDYGKIIGIYVSKDRTKRIPTSIGKIHYDKNARYHVVPSNPELIKIFK